MVQSEAQDHVLPVPTLVPPGPPSLFNISKDDWLGSGFFHRAFDFGERKYHRALGRAAAVTRAGLVGGLCGIMGRLPFTPEMVLFGYAQGMFPIDRGGKVYWHCPDPRCVVPLAQLHVPSRVSRYLQKGLFQLCFDRDPASVLAQCGDRSETWLSHRVQSLYLRLFDLGALHTVEAYSGNRLVGGAFGIALGTVCTVESMFSHEDHAGKLCFAQLCLQLQKCGFTLVDCQYKSPHVERFGAIEIARDEYRECVARGLARPALFRCRGL